MLAGMLPGMFPGMLRGTFADMPLLVSVCILCWRRRRRRCTRTASATVRSAVRSVMMKATEDDDGGDDGGDGGDGGIRNSQRIAFIGRMRRATHNELRGRVHGIAIASVHLPSLM